MKIFNKLKKLNNNGFTLVELLVTISIILIMVTFAGVGIKTLDRSGINNDARKLKILIEETRRNSLNKEGDWWLEIQYINDKDYFVMKEFSGDSTKIVQNESSEGKEGVTTIKSQEFEYTDGITYHVLGDPTKDIESGSTDEAKKVVPRFIYKKANNGVLTSGFTNCDWITLRGEVEITVSVATNTGFVSIKSEE